MTQQYMPTLTGRPTDYLDGNGAFSPILDPTQYTSFYDDFISCLKATTNVSVFQTNGVGVSWVVSVTGTGAAADCVVPADSGCFGSCLLTSGNTTGNICYIIACESISGTSIVESGGYLNATTFDSKFRIAVPTTTNVMVKCGWAGSAGEEIIIRYDTSVPDSTWTANTSDGTHNNPQTITGSVINTSYHTLRMRSVTPGTILYSVDGGAEVSSSTFVPTTTMSPFVQVITRTTAARTVKCDYVWGWVAISR